MSLLAILAAVVIPMTSSTEDFQVEAGARIVRAALERAQSESLRMSVPVSVEFTQGEAVFTLVAHTATGDKAFETVNLVEATGLANMRIRNVDFSASNGVVFQPDGTVMSLMWAQLPADNGVTVGTDRFTIRININPITAMASFK
jgi:hypothetical protein